MCEKCNLPVGIDQRIAAFGLDIVVAVAVEPEAFGIHRIAAAVAVVVVVVAVADLAVELLVAGPLASGLVVVVLKMHNDYAIGRLQMDFDDLKTK